MFRSIIILSVVIFYGLDIVQGKSDGDGNASNTSHEIPIKRFENFVKPPQDPRFYRGLILANRVKVILVTDPSTEKSAASLIVGIGSVHDARNLPGLANLVGYTLMMGSKKYPELYNFNAFVKAHNGYASLPVTREEDQDFHFDIDSAYLADALDRLAQFFIEPLLSYSSEISLEEPLHSVYLEKVARTSEDYYGNFGMEKSMSKRNHPFKHPVLGDMDTFEEHADTLLENVREFYSKLYSSNIMSLVVLGKESLNDLEEMVTNIFENIGDKDVRVKGIRYSCRHHPWGSEELGRKIRIMYSARFGSYLRLTFPVPDVRDYGKLPDVYIASCMIYGGAGSVSSALRRRNLCSELNTRYDNPAGIGFFSITCDLTDDGLNSVDEIVNIIFQYIYLLKEDGIHEWTFHEIKKLHETAFLRYVPDDNPLNSVQRLAINIQDFSVEEIASHNFYRGIVRWDPVLLLEFLNYLRPNNMNLSLASKSYPDDEGPVVLKGGYQYTVIRDELIQKWSTKETIPDLLLPAPSEFVPENLTMYPVGKTEPKYPRIIHQSSVFEIWLKRNDEFQIPELHLEFDIFSPRILLGPSQRTLWRVFYGIVAELLDDYGYLTHTFQLGSFKWVKWEISLSDHDSLRVKLYGYSDKLLDLLEKLMSKIFAVAKNLDQKIFEDALNAHIQLLIEWVKTDHIYQLEWHTQYLQNEGGWTPVHIANVGKRLRLEDMKRFLAQAFQRMFIRGLIHGNCNEQMVAQVIEIMEKYFRSSRGLLLQEQISLPRSIEIADASHFIYDVFNKEPDVFAYSSYFQLNTKSSSPSNVAGYLVSEIIKSLRKTLLDIDESATTSTKCVLMNTSGLRALVIFVKSPLLDPYRMDEKVEKFLRKIQNSVLKNMPLRELNEYKEIVKNKLRRPSSLAELTDKYWYEIGNRSYNFERNEEELNQLSTMNRNDLIDFMEMMFARKSSRRRKLAIHVFPKKTKKKGQQSSDKELSGAKKIENMETFKNTSVLLSFNYSPLPTPTS